MSQSTPDPATPRPGPPRPATTDAAAMDAAVTEALLELGTLDQRPVAEHVGVLTAVHDALARQLSAAES